MIEISNPELAARRWLCQHYWVPVYDRPRPYTHGATITPVRALQLCVLCQKLEAV